MADAVIKGRSIHPLRARLVRRNSLVWVLLRSMSPRVASRRHRYRLAIGVKEKAKSPAPMETSAERMNRSALSTSANIQRGNIGIKFPA